MGRYKKYLAILLMFSIHMMPFHVANAATPKWVLEYIKVEKQAAEKKRLQALLVKQINEAGSLTKTTAVVETVPTASKVGASMLKRVQHVARTPGGAAIGFYAVSQLLEGIGWVMEDGTYVKKIEIIDPSSGSGWAEVNNDTDPKHATAELACQYYAAKKKVNFHHVYLFPDGNIAYCYRTQTEYYVHITRTRKPPVFDTKTVPLTAALLGALMMGTGYKDPDPNFNNDSINTGNWTGVPEAYTPDPSGVGNELYESLEAKADRAPKTSDGKPAPSGDTRYNNDLTSNDNANDRSWDDQGTKGEGGSEKDDEGNEKSWFNLPKWCVWAADNCEWHQEDKAHQAEEKQVWEHEKNHRDQEKGFWQTVKNWFDWFKTDETDKDTEVDIDEDDQIDINSTFNFSKECPASIPLVFNWNGGQLDFTFNFSMLCDVLSTYIYPIVVALGGLHAVYIVSGVRRDG